MPAFAFTLKLKKFRKHFGIAAPRVAVKSYIGWQWHAIGILTLCLVVGVGVWFVARQGDTADSAREIQALRKELSDRSEELVRLRAGAATGQSAVQIERSAQQQLVSRIKLLESENASLKEDVSLFERLLKDCPRRSGLIKHNG